MATFGLSMVHAFLVTQFLFQSRILKPTTFGPKVYMLLSYGLYPVALGATVVVYMRKSEALTRSLDEKYTPIWLDISAKQL